ncbi:hypothetical protein Rhopal_005111-T1 [Rhodotorula paludigena]|uniref:Uncharacterized protein n=1 Tax=Rhodotorula paludigena TaxID=86838 RepID=A0AAV5GQC4_9BASI|nr:hypothetical protein Rhopal_005109-T1 [Rhodotorula paludigena]GJN92082.1 hypothetical protein Rhopal_005111-T1 [Rhodotorula paludigena]
MRDLEVLEAVQARTRKAAAALVPEGVREGLVNVKMAQGAQAYEGEEEVEDKFEAAAMEGLEEQGALAEEQFYQGYEAPPEGAGDKGGIFEQRKQLNVGEVEEDPVKHDERTRLMRSCTIARRELRSYLTSTDLNKFVQGEHDKYVRVINNLDVRLGPQYRLYSINRAEGRRR